MCLQCRRPGFNPWVGKIHWRRKWQSSPVFLPGKFYGQRSLVGYNGVARVRHNLATKPSPTTTRRKESAKNVDTVSGPVQSGEWAWKGRLGTNYGNQCSGDRALFPNSSQLENAGPGKRCRECSQVWALDVQKDGIVWPGAITQDAPSAPAAGEREGVTCDPFCAHPPSVCCQARPGHLSLPFPHRCLFLAPSHSRSQTKGGAGEAPCSS